MLNDDEKWGAVVSKDHRLNGVFWYAVKTTGIYCKPSCPSRRPVRKNIEFYAAPDEARSAGYRPCKRCQPDRSVT